MRTFIFILLLFLMITPLASAKIVFAARVEEGVKGIFVIEDDGSGVTELLTDTRYPTTPRWSPDGKQIVYSRWESPNNWRHIQVVVIDADSTNERVLTVRNSINDYPVFSPNGKSVLFMSERNDRINNDIKMYVSVIDLESGNIKEITEIAITSPDWSPDGKQIVCSNIPTLGKTSRTLWIMDHDGGRARELLPTPPLGEVLMERVYPRWSPNGKKILYCESKAKFNPKHGFIPQSYRYFIYDLSRKQKKQLRIPKTYRCSSLDWMDNGKSIVFSAVEIKLNEPVGTLWHAYHLYKYNIAKGTFNRLTDRTWENPSLDWISDDVFPVSPKGKKKVTLGKLKQ